MSIQTQPDLLTTSAARRAWEVFDRIVHEWPEWQRCQHGNQCVEVMAHWSDEAPFTVTNGRVNHTQRFTRTIHADGSNVVGAFEYGVHNRCPRCGTIDSLAVRQEEWSDRTTCSTEGCGYEHVSMIGD